MANPLNVLYAGSSYLSHDVGSTIVSPLGEDASIGILARDQRKPSLVILVVGETARADHFGLNGYKRNTTPLLEKENIINFSQFFSCGTSTAVSLPCMFSALEREGYDGKKARQQEGLLDVINHAGLSVLWRDNNSGCKGTCDRITNEKSNNSNQTEFCNDDGCYDDILLHDLNSKITSNKSQIIVLHQQGSHGPEYYRRYPEEMTHYAPVCTTNQLHDCSNEQVVNAYDNTIRYTDQFLVRTINWLKEHEKQFNTAMIYISDHGESLGENRLYLHGMPYSIAPDAQIHVPFLMWLSEDFKQDNRINEKCLRQLSNKHFSHDNLFHSVLGMLDINTTARQEDQDIFASCRQ
jgi:lipid A ethanolaminephosphotransferase